GYEATVGFERATPADAATPAPAAAAPTAVPTPAGPARRGARRASGVAGGDAKRSTGRGASALRVIAARSGGTDGRTAIGSGTGPLRRASATPAALSPSHGRVPVSISKSTSPSE